MVGLPDYNVTYNVTYVSNNKFVSECLHDLNVGEVMLMEWLVYDNKIIEASLLDKALELNALKETFPNLAALNLVAIDYKNQSIILTDKGKELAEIENSWNNL